MITNNNTADGKDCYDNILIPIKKGDTEKFVPLSELMMASDLPKGSIPIIMKDWIDDQKKIAKIEADKTMARSIDSMAKGHIFKLFDGNEAKVKIQEIFKCFNKKTTEQELNKMIILFSAEMQYKMFLFNLNLSTKDKQIDYLQNLIHELKLKEEVLSGAAGEKKILDECIKSQKIDLINAHKEIHALEADKMRLEKALSIAEPSNQ